MSLNSLLAMRRNGLRPEWSAVYVGEVPTWFIEPHEVLIDKEPVDLLDLRPLVGLSVTIYSANRDRQRLLSVAGAVEAAGGKIDGIAAPGILIGKSPEHERALLRCLECIPC